MIIGYIDPGAGSIVVQPSSRGRLPCHSSCEQGFGQRLTDFVASFATTRRTSVVDGSGPGHVCRQRVATGTFDPTVVRRRCSPGVRLECLDRGRCQPFCGGTRLGRHPLIGSLLVLIVGFVWGRNWQLGALVVGIIGLALTGIHNVSWVSRAASAAGRPPFGRSTRRRCGPADPHRMAGCAAAWWARTTDENAERVQRPATCSRWCLPHGATGRSMWP